MTAWVHAVIPVEVVAEHGEALAAATRVGLHHHCGSKRSSDCNGVVQLQ